MPDPPSTSKAPAVEISDDLDDLDDILDDFSPAPVPPPAPSTIPPPPSRPAPTPPSSSAPGGGGGGDADFLNQMLRSMSSEPSEEPLTQEEQDELQRLTQMFGRLGGDFDLGSLTEEGQEGEEDDAQARSTAQALSSMFSMLQDLPPEELMRQLQAAEGQEGMPDISSTLRELDLGDLGGAWGDPDDMPLPVAGPARPPASQSPAPVVAKAAPEKPVQSPPTSATVVTASLPASTPSNPTTTTAAATTASTSSPHPVAGPPPPPTYQSALNATLSRLQSSSASASLPSPGAGDPFADLLAGAGAGAGGEEGMQGVLEGLMRSLLSREVLEEPLNELAERYPKYLTEHPDLSLKEKETYTAQLAAVRNMLAIFTAKGYEDGDPEWSVRVVEGMNKLQELGTPPKEVMGELPDLAALGGGLPGTDGCVVA